MRCPICNGPVDVIECDDGSRVADDCVHCATRGCVRAKTCPFFIEEYDDDV